MKNMLRGLFVFLFLLAFTNASFAVEEKTIIKVGISNSTFSNYAHKNAVFVPQMPVDIVDMATLDKVNLEPYSNIEVKLTNGKFVVNSGVNTLFENIDGPVVITGNGKIEIKDLKRAGKIAAYRGMIELKKTSPDSFLIINILDMQSYLKGVVPNEMPVAFGLEALKAQAVAARNYANRQAPSSEDYDVCDSTACQVYFGANTEKEASNRAVDETLGIYALYNNEIILAYYSSTPSGVTEDFRNTFGNFISSLPYLVSVSDSKELLKADTEDYFKTNIPSFDMKSPKYRWKREFQREELETLLSSTLIEQSKQGNVFPAFTGELSGLYDIKTIKASPSRKVLELEIKSESGDYIIRRELPIRRAFKQNNQILPSANFIVEKDNDAVFKTEAPIEPENDKPESPIPLPETVQTIHKNLPQKFTFYGAGFGHGVGMSQFGAGYLSEHGVSYDKILKHYYTGITLGTIPKTVTWNDTDMDTVQEFYFRKKNKTKAIENPDKSPLKDELKKLTDKSGENKCFLVIENPERVSDVEFFINENYFNPEFKTFGKRILTTDITEYLNEGKNKIIFKPLNENNKRKNLKFYLILGEEDER